MAKNKKQQQRVVESAADPVEEQQVVQTETVEDQHDPEDVAALRQMTNSYADVENVQMKISDDRQAAMVLMRHLDGQHTILMAARNATGAWIGVRAILVKAGGDLSDFQKPSSVKPV